MKTGVRSCALSGLWGLQIGPGWVSSVGLQDEDLAAGDSFLKPGKVHQDWADFLKSLGPKDDGCKKSSVQELDAE